MSEAGRESIPEARKESMFEAGSLCLRQGGRSMCEPGWQGVYV